MKCKFLRFILSVGLLNPLMTIDPALAQQITSTSTTIGPNVGQAQAAQGDGSLLNVTPTGSSTTHTLADTAAFAYNSAQLDSNTKVLASLLINRPQITPLTTTVGTTATTIYPSGTYVGVSITLQSYGIQIACTVDGSTPVISTSPTMNGVGETITWSVDLPVTASPACIASQGTAIITTKATS